MLPKPLIEVACEIRKKPTPGSAITLLMSVVKSFNDAHINISQKQGLHIPNEVKKEQNELCFIPSYEISYENFSILISDGSLVILEKNIEDSQYRGWEIFKKTPMQLCEILNTSQASIQRISLRYTNLIDLDLIKNQINFSLYLANKNKSFDDSDRIEFRSINQHDQMINVLEIIYPTTIQMQVTDVDIVEKSGILLSIDTAFHVTDSDKIYDSILETIHTASIKRFEDIYEIGGQNV